MKLTVKHWAGLLTVVFLLLLGPYFFKFHYGLSGNSQDWANFGTYIGGTLGPIGAFLAFWGLMQQNKMYRDNAEIERLISKLTLLDSDILILTGKCFITPDEWKLRNGMKSYSYVYGAEIETNPLYLDTLLTADEPASKDIIQEKSTDIAHIAGLRGIQQKQINYRLLCALESKIKLINHYIITIQSISPNNVEIAHYNNKYQYLLKEMHKKKWINFDSFGSQIES
ncbi:hypothetical protein [Shewanella xiamenensis]|uniref:hypothetical protein n=1 Tax=Shewanella xiamenensis TaxID=332186 RepID=UPI00313DE816